MSEAGSDSTTGSGEQETSTTTQANTNTNDKTGAEASPGTETSAEAASPPTSAPEPKRTTTSLDSTAPVVTTTAKTAQDKPLALLNPNGISDVGFGTEAEEANAALSQLLGPPTRDSGWVLLNAVSDVEGFSDLPNDAVSSQNVAILPEVRYQCWDQETFQTCAIFSGDISNRWFSGWEQAVTAEPTKAPEGLMTTQEGWGAGQAAQPIADTAEISGGEGSMALFTGRGYSGRIEGMVPFDDSVKPTIGDYVTCITAWMDRPMPGFGDVCGRALAFPETSTS